MGGISGRHLRPLLSYSVPTNSWFCIYLMEEGLLLHLSTRKTSLKSQFITESIYIPAQSVSEAPRGPERPRAAFTRFSLFIFHDSSVSSLASPARPAAELHHRRLGTQTLLCLDVVSGLRGAAGLLTGWSRLGQVGRHSVQTRPPGPTPVMVFRWIFLFSFFLFCPHFTKRLSRRLV